jgi:signal transduction histidine kinase
MSSSDISWMPAAAKLPIDPTQPVPRAEYDRVCSEMQSLVYLIAHDLNAPLRAVRGFADILSESLGSEVSENDAKCLEIIGQSSVRAQARLDGILQVARVESLADSYSLVDLNVVLDELRTQFQAELDADRIELTLGKLPQLVGDARQVTHLFRELLTNSMQHGRAPGKSEILIESKPSDDGWIITLRDNGAGLKDEDLQDAFKLFWKASPSEYIERSGAGLTVCRRIIDRHCGQIGLSANRPTGLCVHLRFPDARVGAGEIHRHQANT